MLLELQRLNVPPGQKVWLHNVTWSEFETILNELGEHRSVRLAYDNGNLEIMTPLPEHESGKEIIGDLIKVLLEELNLEFCSLGSTTFKHERIAQGIEPDQCFYIQHEQNIRGKNRIDLDVDPPPDLVLEIDLTSRTHPSIYAKLGVPELWRFEKGTLEINLLVGDEYAIAQDSRIFPGVDIAERIPHFLRQARIAGRTAAMKAFRQWIRSCLAT